MTDLGKTTYEFEIPAVYGPVLNLEDCIGERAGLIYVQTKTTDFLFDTSTNELKMLTHAYLSPEKWQ